MKIVNCVLITLLASASCLSAPPYPGKIVFEQADGSTFSAYLKGDEWFHWIEDSEQNIIIYNASSKNYELAIVKEIAGEPELVASGLVYSTESTANVPNNAAALQGGLESSVEESISRDALTDIWQRKRQHALSRMNRN